MVHGLWGSGFGKSIGGDICFKCKVGKEIKETKQVVFETVIGCQENPQEK